MLKTMMVLALAIAAPAGAQTGPAAAPGNAGDVAAAPAPLDPARLAAAQRLVAAMMPPSSLQRMMGAAMGEEFFREMEQAMGPEFIAQMTARDPHYRERSRIEMQIAREEMGRVFAAAEPAFLEGLSRFYARTLSLADIEEAARFYSTPAGRRLGAESVALIASPEYRDAMLAISARMSENGPRVAERVAAATAHLPPPPEPDFAADPDFVAEPDPRSGED